MLNFSPVQISISWITKQYKIVIFSMRHSPLSQSLKWKTIDDTSRPQEPGRISGGGDGLFCQHLHAGRLPVSEPADDAAAACVGVALCRMVFRQSDRLSPRGAKQG